MGSPLSRNKPCSCGSGRKYKKCCLAPTPTEASRRSLTDEVAAYALRVTGAADLQIAWEEFGETGSVKRPDARRFGLFMDWLITGRRRDGQTLLQRFEGERGATLNDAERGELETHKATDTGIYEVVAVHPGTGLTVKDIFSEEEFEVADVSASRGASVWDVLGMRLRRIGGPAQAWGEVFVFSPLDRAELKFELEAAYRMAMVCEPKLEWQPFLNSAAPLLKRLQAGFLARRSVSAMVSAHPAKVDPRRAIAQALAEHSNQWPDKPVPALGGRTPREAAAETQGRIHLADLLKEYERGQARKPSRADIFDLANVPAIVWMRKALGLPIPKELAALQRRLTAKKSAGR